MLVTSFRQIPHRWGTDDVHMDISEHVACTRTTAGFAQRQLSTPCPCCCIQLRANTLTQSCSSQHNTGWLSTCKPPYAKCNYHSCWHWPNRTIVEDNRTKCRSASQSDSYRYTAAASITTPAPPTHTHTCTHRNLRSFVCHTHNMHGVATMLQGNLQHCQTILCNNHCWCWPTATSKVT